MAKHPVLTILLAAEIFLAQEQVAYAPTTSPSNFNPQTSSVSYKKDLLEKKKAEYNEKLNESLQKFNELERIREIERQRQRQQHEKKLMQEDPIYVYIYDAFRRLNINGPITKQFVRAQIWKEAEDTWNAVGKAGERGFMQILPAAWYSVEQDLNYEKSSLNPWNNVYVGVKYLHSLEDKLSQVNPKWSNLSDAEKRRIIAASYNCGIGTVMDVNYDLEKIPQTTKQYIQIIEALMSRKYKEY